VQSAHPIEHICIEHGWANVMGSKTFFSSSHQATGRLQRGTDIYLNQMFSLVIIGILAFFGVAWMIGKTTPAPLSEQLSLRLSTQMQLNNSAVRPK
jgi:hypothetical protein